MLFGPGQGSTLGPFCGCYCSHWLSSIRPKTWGIHLSSADSRISVNSFGDAFVDDSFIGTIPSRPQALNHPSHTTTKELALKALGNLTILAQQWEHLLFTTGGEICLSKSFWYLLSWKWTKAGTARPNSSSASPASLQLTSGYDTNKINVPRVEPTSTYRYWVRVSLLLEPLPAQ